MPPKKKSSSKSKPYKPRSKTMKSNKRYGQKTSKVGKELFPNTKFCVMNYKASGGLGTGTSQNLFGTLSNSYYLNTIYNPYSTGGTQNCQGYDQIKDIYAKYKVNGCKVTMTFSNPDIDGLVIGVRVHQSGSTDMLTSEQYANAAMKKWTFIKPINDSGKQTWSFTKYFDIAYLEGLTKTQFEADITYYNSAITAQPTKSPFIEVALANSATTADENISYKISIDYYVQLYDRQILPLSTIV